MGLLAMPALAAIAAGYLLGRIPVLNVFLHMTWWLIVPTGAFLTACALAWVAFQMCRFLEIPTGGQQVKFVLMGACIAGFIATDFGIYETITIPVKTEFVAQPEEGAPPPPQPKPAKISEQMSFVDYMLQIRLATSTVKTKGGLKLDLGPEATTARFIIDLIGAGMGSFAMLIFLSTGMPFCERCKKYKKPATSMSIAFRDEDEIRDNYSMIKGSMAQSYQHLAKLLAKLKHLQVEVNPGRYRVDASELVCPQCKEATILGKVFKRTADDWNELGDKPFHKDSEEGVGGLLHEPYVPPPEKHREE